MTPDRLLQILNSKSAYKELINIAKKLGIDTTGGKMQIHKRIMESSKKVYSEISKYFTAMTGKNGGILHGQCPCGCTYDMKFLTLPEGVSDYTEIIMSMEIKPTITVSDIAHLLARHTNLVSV